MNPFRTITLWLFRLSGIVLVALGLLFWSGRAYDLLSLHMTVGLVFTVSYLAIVGFAAESGLSTLKVMLAGAWGFVVPVFGVLQTRLLPGAPHLYVRIAHLLIGIIAMAVGNQLARRMAAPRAQEAEGSTAHLSS